MAQKDGGGGGAIKEGERNNMWVPWDGNKKRDNEGSEQNWFPSGKVN